MERLTYSVEEVSRMLGCSRRTVVREIQRGRLTAIRVGRLVRVSAQSLTAYVDRPSMPGNQPGTRSNARLNGAARPPEPIPGVAVS